MVMVYGQHRGALCLAVAIRSYKGKVLPHCLEGARNGGGAAFGELPPSLSGQIHLFPHLAKQC